MPKFFSVKYFSLFLLSILLQLGLNAQTTVIGGKVIDVLTNEVLVGATVSIPSLKLSKVTDVEGRFSLSVKPGSYTIQVESIGFLTKEVSGVQVTEDNLKELVITMETQAKELSTVVVSASARKESVASVLALQKNNASISDGISIEAIRKSPDRNVGEVLKRVSGTSVQDDKFVVVRGLGDRYNVALINGALLPSTEPDRRAFAFDFIPSNLIDNILINKTASPDMPGDFSGGVIQVMTKDIPFKNFFNIGVGTSVNSISTGKPFKVGMIRNTDYLGFDDGTRQFSTNFPATSSYRGSSLDDRLAASRLMRNNYGNRYDGNAWPGLNLQLSWGGKKELKNGGTVGTVLAANWRNTQNIQYSERRDYQSPTNISTDPSNLIFDYADTLYQYTTTIGGLANFAYKKGNSKIAFKNIFNKILDNTNLRRVGVSYDNIQYKEGDAAITLDKAMISSQLEGEHKISDRNDRIKWNLNYTLTTRNQPDYRILPYQKNLDDIDNKAVPLNVVLRDTYRFWSELMDNAAGAKVDYSLPVRLFNEKGSLKAGFFGQYKVRDFSTRIFRYEQASNVFNRELLSASPETVFNDGYIYREGFVLNEITNNTDRYDANSGLYAGYLMFDGRVSDKLRAVVGARVEAFDFLVKTANFSGQPLNVKRNYLDVLPSVNLTYSVSDKSNVRVSASRTVSRPEFREVANFAYFDFIRNAQLKGNPDLERSQNTNLDLRFETYPTGGEIISVSGFYKHFAKPIEQVVLSGSTSTNLILSYQNPESAQNYGVELEVRKRMDFMGPWAEHLFFNTNAAYIWSKVKFNEENNPYDPDRPMQGQSNYLLNLGLQYATANEKLSFSALFNRIGPRIAYVGFQGYPDIYENARSVIDLQVGVKVLRNKGEFKLGVGDLLNQKSIFYQNGSIEDNRGYKNGSDRVQYSFLYGTTVSVGFAYGF